MSVQLVVFAINEEEYGIDVSAVNGILRAKKFTIRALPRTPKVIEGMINVRGQIVYVLNLRHKFGFAEKSLTEESKFIMLNVGEANTSCIVDEVTDIVKLADEELLPAPDFVTGISAKYIQGIGKIDDRMIIILDSSQLLTFDEYAAIENS